MPAQHIFVGSKAGWEQITDDLPRHERGPHADTRRRSLAGCSEFARSFIRGAGEVDWAPRPASSPADGGGIGDATEEVTEGRLSPDPL
jgi:hypothetical protein